MAENNEQNNEQRQQFVCTGDCLNCHPNQRQYCAAQKGYDNQRLLLEMRESLSAMATTIEELKIKHTEAESAEAQVFAPVQDNIPSRENSDGQNNGKTKTK